MSGISTLRLRWLRAFGQLPSTAKLESRYARERAYDARLVSILESEEYTRWSGLSSLVERGVTLDAAQAEEYASLRKGFARSSDYKWCQRELNRGRLDGIAREREVFFDDFDSPDGLDASVWSPRFFWGDVLLGGKPYSFVGDPHGYTDGLNVRVGDGLLTIETRREAVSGLAWDSRLGFIPHRFAYTSGLVTTAQGFRQTTGRFEAKVRYNFVKGVFHSFYLRGDRVSPHLDVFRSSAEDPASVSGVYIGAGWEDGARGTLGHLPLDTTFFILSVEWRRDSIRWFVNGVRYHEVARDLPGEPLYLVVASGVSPEAMPEATGRLQIDWVRCTALND